MNIESSIKNLMDIAFKTLTDGEFLIGLILFMFTTTILTIDIIALIVRYLEVTGVLIPVEYTISGTDKEIRKEK